MCRVSFSEASNLNASRLMDAAASCPLDPLPLPRKDPSLLLARLLVRPRELLECEDEALVRSLLEEGLECDDAGDGREKESVVWTSSGLSVVTFGMLIDQTGISRGTNVTLWLNQSRLLARTSSCTQLSFLSRGFEICAFDVPPSPSDPSHPIQPASLDTSSDTIPFPPSVSASEEPMSRTERIEQRAPTVASAVS